MVTTSDILAARVLIVDDLEANVHLLAKILGSAGYTSVASTLDPFEVCALHREHRYDLILLDLQMPGMDGFQVMEGLKEIDPEGYLPVLVVTAQPGQKLRALQAGAKDFISKPFELAEVLARVRNMLEVRLLHRETKDLYDLVVAEQQASERLLLNILPRAIAERLKARDGVIADGFPEVTVLFADLVGFTKLASDVRPEELVRLLDEIFSDFDRLADVHGIEKIKTIGDAYMAVAGVPVTAADHGARAAHMALDMMDALAAFNARNGYTLQMRIGIDSGAVVAGVIGRSKFIYDLWGETVNTASRMESHGVPGRIQVTDATRRRLQDPFVLVERGTIEVKGTGPVHAWFLCGRRGR